MTDRVNGLFVALDEDIREDDIQPIIDAIMQIKRVVSVKTSVSDMNSYVAYARAKEKILTEIIGVFTKSNT